MPPRKKLWIELEEEKEKPIWEAYQVLWANEEHNELPPILSWDNNNKKKGKQKEELTWETDDLTWIDNDETGNEKKTKKIKRKEKKKRPPKPLSLITPTLYHNNLPIVDLSLYALIVVRNCHQWAHAVATMRNTTSQQNSTVIYAYSNALDDQKDKKNGITNLMKGCGMTFQDVEERATCPHDDDKIWQMALAKIEGATPEEIKVIKDNSPEPLELDWDAEPIINLLDPEQFHKHYQELASTREE
ncbi:hypothetical protein G9A89_023556 [Geosiphon pyriformis]|nr:hypothetical protein G9A89_023556 [Geosiphon pyriformis]